MPFFGPDDPRNVVNRVNALHMALVLLWGPGAEIKMTQLKALITFSYLVQGRTVDNYVATMKSAGLIDADNENTGGASKLVTINPLPTKGLAKEDTERMQRIAGVIRNEYLENSQ